MSLEDEEDYLRKVFAADGGSLVFKATVESDEIEYAEFEILEDVPLLEKRDGVSTQVEYEWPLRKKAPVADLDT